MASVRPAIASALGVLLLLAGVRADDARPAAPGSTPRRPAPPATPATWFPLPLAVHRLRILWPAVLPALVALVVLTAGVRGDGGRLRRSLDRAQVGKPRPWCARSLRSGHQLTSGQRFRDDPPLPPRTDPAGSRQGARAPISGCQSGSRSSVSLSTKRTVTPVSGSSTAMSSRCLSAYFAIV